MTMNDFLTDISDLKLEELLALRAAIDTRLEEKRAALLEQAQRVGGVIGNGKKRARKSKGETE